MATFNGELYIKTQLESILSQIGFNDEVIIVDDCSKDLTISFIQELNDPRIKLFINSHNMGFVKTFEKAIKLSQGEIIFFSDQDDYWLPGRVQEMASRLVAENAYLLVSQFFVTKIQGIVAKCPAHKDIENSFSWKSIFFGGSNFFGSTMCMDRKLLKFIMPFNFYVTAHDIHIAIIAKMLGKLKVINSIYTLRTITGNNLSTNKRPFVNKIISRLNYMFSLLHFLIRKYLILNA